jgi:competence protein ComEA
MRQRSPTPRPPLIIHGPLGAALASRAFVPACAVLTLVLLAGSALLVAPRLGWSLPGFASSPHTLVITGPGTNETPAPLQAEILGAVAQPGVYTLVDGARVRDLVQTAGGLLPDADTTRVDLAAPVANGQDIYVPHIGETVPADLTGLVNINTASADDLHLALGISLDIARRIVAYRATHGNFTAVSQLLLVPISRSTYDRIKYLVTV